MPPVDAADGATDLDQELRWLQEGVAGLAYLTASGGSFTGDFFCKHSSSTPDRHNNVVAL